MPTGAKQFVWYDVMTTDTKAAEAFYRSVVGWTAKPAEVAGPPYTLFSAGENMVAGLMPIPDDARAAGIPPCWTGYIGVEDVDDYCARATKAGGSIMRPPADIPDVGRFAVVLDPHGAAFILFTPFGAPPQPEIAPGTPGHIGWHELRAGDLQTAFNFYSGLFGWTKAEAVDMGPALGTYQIFAAGGPSIGGMMTRTQDMPSAHWLYYFNVPAIDAAMSRVTQGGGKVISGPMQVPGGGWITQCADPQGAMFALVAPTR